MKKNDLNIRQDIQLQSDVNIVKSIQNIKKKNDRLKGNKYFDSVDRIPNVRRSLIETEKSDPNGFERVIGESQLLSVNFLSRGQKAAKTVCRIRVPMKGGGEWFGTGFLVGPRLLLTNHHVIARPEEASQCEAEFGYEHDEDGVLKQPIKFNLSPIDIFYTDKDHDITFVSVAGYSEGGVPLERFGFIPLLPLTGKGIRGEWVTIIQHPNGLPKQMTIRASQIIELEDKITNPKVFVHYTTDTDPGSSGSPVLNDQWQAVAIHHKAVRDPNSSDDDIQWLANEGIRISAIFNMLERKRFSDINVSKVLDRLSRGIGVIPSNLWSSGGDFPTLFEAERKPYKDDYWNRLNNLGYDSNFLPVKIELLDIVKGNKRKLAKLKNKNSYALDYLHFSALIHKERRFPFLTAVNILGSELKHPGGRSDSWRKDIRMDEKYQPADNFYKRKLQQEHVYFSRGHLVRRFDPCWGTQEEAALAEEHTFHFANAAPQVQRYNNVEWGDLEDYILNQTQTLEKKVTVFTGPIFKDNDPIYGIQREGGPWKIPVSYWKIAVVKKTDNSISAAAFIVGQIEYVQALYEARVFSGLNPYSYEELQSRRIQTTIETIEEETGLNFSAIKGFDALNALESSRQTKFLSRNEEIVI